MEDIFIEQLVQKKQTQNEHIKKYLVYALVAILSFFAFLIIPIMLPIVIIIGFFIAYTYGSTRNVEFEYTFTNTELDVDAIYNKQKRKRVFTCDLKECTSIFRSNNETESTKYTSLKLNDYSSGDNYSNTYTIVISDGSKSEKIIIEPDDRLIKAIQIKSGRKFIKD